jgi:hypothetical protein
MLDDGILRELKKRAAATEQPRVDMNVLIYAAMNTSRHHGW